MKSLEGTSNPEFSVAMPAAEHKELAAHLLKSKKEEDVAFALYKPSDGARRFTALIYKIIFPEKGDRIQHGNVEITPQYFKRVCQIACSENAGIALLHSHPSPSIGWQGMSPDDITTEQSYSPTCATLTDLPFIGLTLSSDETWSARIWKSDKFGSRRQDAVTVRIVGKRLQVSYNDFLLPVPEFKDTFKRTLTVWGADNHAHLARLRVGIVGLGSVGSIVAEHLARMGMERVVLIDFDEVQEHNLDRLSGATLEDIGNLKISVAERQLRRAATARAIDVIGLPYPITEEKGYRGALDCDVLFSCVDRPWPRSVLNHIAYSHLIPVIDGGIAVRLNSITGMFEGADWQVQTVGPDRACLCCLKAFDPSHVSTERDGKLDDPSYLTGLPQDHLFKRNENIFPFSTNLASLEVMQFIEMVTSMGGTEYYGPQRYSYNHGFIRLLGEDNQCTEECFYQAGLAQGDTLFPAPIGHDHAAAAAKLRQK
ncbi:MAG: ThiF family adenylyltransferase [Williamsia sp.]|nr:ThiF family adenylyltransferase [Williamsia sp.]